VAPTVNDEQIVPVGGELLDQRAADEASASKDGNSHG
jgi:hypothetical protein